MKDSAAINYKNIRTFRGRASPVSRVAAKAASLVYPAEIASRSTARTRSIQHGSPAARMRRQCAKPTCISPHQCLGCVFCSVLPLVEEEAWHRRRPLYRSTPPPDQGASYRASLGYSWPGRVRSHSQSIPMPQNNFAFVVQDHPNSRECKSAGGFRALVRIVGVPRAVRSWRAASDLRNEESLRISGGTSSEHSDLSWTSHVGWCIMSKTIDANFSRMLGPAIPSSCGFNNSRARPLAPRN